MTHESLPVEISRKIAGLAEVWHPAQLPSDQDFEYLDLVTFVRTIDKATTVSDIVYQAFHGLAVSRKEILEPYLKEQAKYYEKNIEPNMGQEPAELTMNPSSALRFMFTSFREMVQDTRSIDTMQLLDRAERFGCFVVEQAVSVFA